MNYSHTCLINILPLRWAYYIISLTTKNLFTIVKICLFFIFIQKSHFPLDFCEIIQHQQYVLYFFLFNCLQFKNEFLTEGEKTADSCCLFIIRGARADLSLLKMHEDINMTEERGMTEGWKNTLMGWTFFYILAWKFSAVIPLFIKLFWLFLSNPLRNWSRKFVCAWEGWLSIPNSISTFGSP